MDYNTFFKDPTLCKKLLIRLEDILSTQESFRFMEVCGTHTVSIFQSGLRSLFPEKVQHLTGPGCPVCVTHDREVATFLKLAENNKVIIATFGDILRIPGPGGYSLKDAQAQGARIEIVYSPLDIIGIAKKNPHDLVVFLGVGFETTAPTVAATLLMVREQKMDNVCILSFHKLVPPALRALAGDLECKIDAFLLPGHVAIILGLEPFNFLVDEFAKPCAVAGFEPIDILAAICQLAEQKVNGQPKLLNSYLRAVSDKGNPKARAIMYEVFEISDAMWRGLGLIKNSGLVLTPEFEKYDAMKRLGLSIPEVKSPSGCKCGEILKGNLSPNLCPLFGKKCTPASPVGPCMVSTEGSCAAYFKYNLD